MAFITFAAGLESVTGRFHVQFRVQRIQLKHVVMERATRRGARSGLTKLHRNEAAVRQSWNRQGHGRRRMRNAIRRQFGITPFLGVEEKRKQ